MRRHSCQTFLGIAREQRATISNEAALRLGSAALGLITGLVVGLVLACLAIYALGRAPAFPRFVFGGGAIGMLVGLVYPEDALRIAEGVIHFLFGFTTSSLGQHVPADQDAPKWLRMALWAGVLLGLVVALLA